MKIRLYALILAVFLYSCKETAKETIHVPRPLTANEDFNNYPKNPEDVLKLVKVESQVQNKGVPEEIYSVRFRDSLLKIQPDEKDKTFLKDRFSLAEMVSTQQTAALVQLEGSVKAQAPFFLITAKDGKVEVISLYRASKGANDEQYAKGMIRVGRSGYLINNDYFVTTVNAKVYPIQRQDEAERIQGQFFLQSKDKMTLVFLTKDSFYQVHYPTGSVSGTPLPKKAPKSVENIYKFIQDNYRWVKNGKGIEFLQYVDADAIVDISEFKK
jgi:hypothetical protein